MRPVQDSSARSERIMVQWGVGARVPVECGFYGFSGLDLWRRSRRLNYLLTMLDSDVLSDTGPVLVN